MDNKITRASNGKGLAAQSSVEILRAPGNMILDLTTTQNFPGINDDNTVSGEIFHFGCWSADGGGVLVPGTLVEGKAHVSNIGEVTIDSLDPGFTDKGNNIGDIFMVKPTTGWANDLADALKQSLKNDGTLKENIVGKDNIDWSTMGNQSTYVTLGDVKIMFGTASITLNGTTANSFGSTSVTLPTSFTGTNYRVTISLSGDPGSSFGMKIGTTSRTTSSFTAFAATASITGTASWTANWIAIGV